MDIEEYVKYRGMIILWIVMFSIGLEISRWFNLNDDLYPTEAHTIVTVIFCIVMVVLNLGAIIWAFIKGED